MRTRHSIALLAGALIGASTLVAGPGAPAQALSFSMTVVSPVEGRIGVDVGAGPEYSIKTCSNTPGVPTLGWNSAGQLVGTTSLPGSPTSVRFEMYPGPCGTYDGWGNVGGVHFDAGASGDYGTIRMPVVGDPGVFALRGAILSSTPIGTGRVIVDTFQIPTGYPDPPAPLQQNGRVQYGAFASTASRGAAWSGGVGWAGRYLLFVTDTATGRKITANVDIGPTSIPTIDLDAICFGFDNCVYNAGGPGVTAGSFHPTTPTRILDTRRGLGIWGPVRSGDGRHPSMDPLTRRDETANHELQVTGRNGIPASGVSAVLLNVTAVSAGAPGPGFMSVVPRPAGGTDVFNDQGTYSTFPSTSNLNIDDADPVPNLVLARVGAGGKIRIANYLGPTHVIADVAGWFGTGGAHTDGAGFAGVVPERVMDSRTRDRWAGESVRCRRDPLGPGGRRCRHPAKRAECRREHHADRSRWNGIRHRVPERATCSRRIERQHRRRGRSGEHRRGEGRHRRADQSADVRDQRGRDRRRARELRPLRRDRHDHHAGTHRRLTHRCRHAGRPLG